MQYDKIYFLENLYGIKNFLTLYNFNESNLIVVSEESVSLINFLNNILPHQEIIKIPRIPINFIPSEHYFDKQFKQLYHFKDNYSHCLDYIQPPSKIIFFTWTNAFHFYILLSELVKKFDIQFIDVLLGNDKYAFQPIDLNSLSEIKQNYFKKLSEIVGFQLIPLDGYNWVALGLKVFAFAESIIHLSWKEISTKFSIKNFNINKEYSLIIDAAIHYDGPKGVDPDLTQKKLISFFEKQLLKGKMFHLKPHYNEICIHHSFHNTHLQEKIKILPKSFPVELILNHYDEVYTISGFSTSIYDQFDCKIYSLAKLLEFKNDESKKYYWKLFKYRLYDHKTIDINDEIIELIKDEHNSNKRTKNNYDRPVLAASLRNLLIQHYDKIYFIDSLNGIQYFLTIYNPSEKNLIITSKDSKPLNDFFKHVFPNQLIIPIPRIEMLINQQKNIIDFEQQINQLIEFKKEFDGCLKELSPPSQIIFFSWTNTFHFYVLLSDLKKRNIDIQYINISLEKDEKQWIPVEDHSQNSSLQEHIQKLSEIIGLNIIPLERDTELTLGLEEFRHQSDMTADPWQKIIQKYKIEQFNVKKDAILFIDSPIFDDVPNGINADMTHRLLVDFIEKQIDKGKKFHLKPYSSETYHRSSLDGATVQDKIKHLPKYLPLELILNQYNEIYLISGGEDLVKEFFQIKFYSLASLIVFNNSNIEQHYWNVFKNNYKEYTLRWDQDNLLNIYYNYKLEQNPFYSDGASDYLVSVLVPTMNRSDFVKRMLTYYHTVGFNGYICIGDSSNENHTNKIKEIIKKYDNKLKIIYDYLPKENNTIMAVNKKLVELAPTPYVAFSGDDDFLIAKSLGICAEFLTNNPEYISVRGLRLDLIFQDRGAYSKIKDTRYVRQPTLEHMTANERWTSYLRYPIATMYSVFDKQIALKMFPQLDSFTSHYIASELFPSGLIPITGKMKGLDCLSIIFQVQDSQDKVFSWDRENILMYMLQPDWSPTINHFKKLIVKELVHYDDITTNDASYIFDRELCNHIIVLSINQYFTRYGELNPHMIQEIPSLMGSQHTIYSLITSPNFIKVVKQEQEDYVNQMIRKNNLDLKTANDLFYKNLWGYLIILLQIYYENQYSNLDIDCYYYQELSDYETVLSLDSLLDPSSVYHNEFMPIYNVINQNIPE